MLTVFEIVDDVETRLEIVADTGCIPLNETVLDVTPIPFRVKVPLTVSDALDKFHVLPTEP